MFAQSTFVDREAEFFQLNRDVCVSSLAPGTKFCIEPDKGLLERFERIGPFIWFNPVLKSAGVMGGNVDMQKEHCAHLAPFDVIREFRIQPYTGRHADHLEFCAQLLADDPNTFYNGLVLLTLHKHGLHALDAFAKTFSSVSGMPVVCMEPFTD